MTILDNTGLDSIGCRLLLYVGSQSCLCTLGPSFRNKLFFEELSFLVLRMFRMYNHWPNKVPTKF